MEKGSGAVGEQSPPRVLVFSTVTISDVGIDLAGSAHMHYPPSSIAIPLPCSSGIRPEWILYALQHGFDGVFIAADGTDCPFVPDCTARTAKIVDDGQALLKENNIEPSRLKMAAVCSVCAEPFVKHMKNFQVSLKKLGSTQGAD
ncbi:MAG: hydrogenase iron-sulfur subunit [candidate division Zixibacteria bacterium]|nr:hydrogenase iron-sulfur subunit [candidate division Zixibacteria bacterium]